MAVFRCECVTPERTLFIVTDHAGNESRVLYCDGCHDMALHDDNGETAAVRRPTRMDEAVETALDAAEGQHVYETPTEAA